MILLGYKDDDMVFFYNKNRRSQMKTLIFLAKGFETMEFSAFVDIMGWARNEILI